MFQFQHWHFLYLCPSLLLETIETFLIRIYQICRNGNTWKHGKHVNNNNGNISSIWQLKSVFLFPNTAHFFNIIIWIHCYLQCKIPFDLSFFDVSSIRQKKKGILQRRNLGIFIFYCTNIVSIGQRGIYEHGNIQLEGMQKNKVTLISCQTDASTTENIQSNW